MKKEFKIGEIVWVNPVDHKIIKAKVIGFQKVDPYNPIVEGKTSAGENFKSAFYPDRINHYREGKYFKEWRFI